MAVLGCFVAACATSDEPSEFVVDEASPPVATERDGGHLLDAGGRVAAVDAGVRFDAGAPVRPFDAGFSRDAGAVRDAGGLRDAGTAHDAGVFRDAGVSADAGMTLDAGRCPAGFRDDDDIPANGCETPCAPFILSASGVRNFDLQTIQVAGRVTLDGQTAPAGSPRGALSFLRVGTTLPVTVELPTSGEAVFSTKLFPGFYSVTFSKFQSCAGTTLPCGTQFLKRSLQLTADGAIDFDVRSVVRVTVSGEVTVNGSMMGVSTRGGTRGSVSFRAHDGQTAATVAFPTQGRSLYSVDVPMGDYDVVVTGPRACESDSPIPCHASTRMTAVPIRSTGALNIDLPVTTVSGTVTVNAQPMATRASGATRGVVAIMGSEGLGPNADLGLAGAATYRAVIYKGVHSIALSSWEACAVGPLPCGTNTVRTGIQVQSVSSLDIDVSTTSVSGTVTVNGAAMAENADGRSRGMVTLRGPSSVTATLGSTGAATFTALVYKGQHDVSFYNFYHCETGPTPCQFYDVARGVSIVGPASLPIDLPVIDVAGTVTANGFAVGASDAGSNRGELHFSSPTLGQSAATLGATNAATYRIRLFPGTYDITFSNDDDCPALGDGVLPCQGRVEIRRDVDLRASGNLDFDLDVVMLSGVVTLRGFPMPASLHAKNRGSLILWDAAGNGMSTIPLGVDGGATFQRRFVAGRYEVGVENRRDCVSGVLPCQSLPLIGCRVW